MALTIPASSVERSYNFLTNPFSSSEKFLVPICGCSDKKIKYSPSTFTRYLISAFSLKNYASGSVYLRYRPSTGLIASNLSMKNHSITTLLRLIPFHRPREGYGIFYRIQTADPGDQALYAHA